MFSNITTVFLQCLLEVKLLSGLMKHLGNAKLHHYFMYSHNYITTYPNHFESGHKLFLQMPKILMENNPI